MKKFLSFMTTSIFASSLIFSSVYAANTEITVPQQQTQAAEQEQTHTVTIQRVQPIKLGDEYSWEITSEPGQLAESVTALGLGYRNPELYGEDTVITFTQDMVDIDKICDKFHLDIDASTISNDMPITITYSQADVDAAMLIQNSSQTITKNVPQNWYKLSFASQLNMNCATRIILERLTKK